jgi:hypothetical protein
MANFNKNVLIVLLVDICLVLLIILRPGFQSSNPALHKNKGNFSKMKSSQNHIDTIALLNTGMLSNDK